MKGMNTKERTNDGGGDVSRIFRRLSLPVSLSVSPRAAASAMHALQRRGEAEDGSGLHLTVELSSAL